ncbi:MAG TPA: hypothetical protein PKC96_07215 [Bacilli bacterium]|nr:hypothetical protein [Bacilli bacterium]
MANVGYPILCGGTVFTLVLEARRQRTSQRSRYEGEQDGLSQTETLAGLGRVVYTEYEPPKNRQTFRTNVNAYKSCTDEGSNLSFLFPGARDAFDNRVKTEYPKALRAMCSFVDQFLEVGTSLKNEEKLVKALLELIESDTSISDQREFFICDSRKGIPKSTIRLMSDFTLQPFLLGVWHYVVTEQLNNKFGKETFDAWCPPKDRAERKYEGNMGSGIIREINVEMLTTFTDEAIAEGETVVTQEPAAEETVMPVLDADPKRITVNNYGTVQNQKFISVETMHGDIHL